MIHYQLRCAADHGFDAWFSDSAAFDSQRAEGLLRCPCCGDARVDRALMTPTLGRARGRRPPDRDAGPASPNAAPGLPAAPDAMPDGLRAALQRLREHVERHCEPVGPGFAAAARRMHGAEEPARAIYGEATAEEAEALAEEGIAFAQIPWVPRSQS